MVVGNRKQSVYNTAPVQGKLTYWSTVSEPATNVVQEIGVQMNCTLCPLIVWAFRCWKILKNEVQGPNPAVLIDKFCLSKNSPTGPWACLTWENKPGMFTKQYCSPIAELLRSTDFFVIYCLCNKLKHMYTKMWLLFREIVQSSAKHFAPCIICVIFLCSQFIQNSMKYYKYCSDAMFVPFLWEI